MVAAQPSSPARRIGAALFAPVDTSIFAFFRVAFGLILLWECWRYYSKGWIHILYIEPEFFFPYYGFEWVKPLPGDGMYFLFAGLALCAIFIAIGLLYRLSALLFFVGFSWVFLIDRAHFLNHIYLVCLLALLLVFLPGHRSYSVDAWLRPSLRARTAPAWTLWLLRFQIAVPYFFGGVAKLSPDWLQGQPMGIWLSQAGDWPLIGGLLVLKPAAYFFSWGGAAFDLLIVPALLWRPTRIPAYGVALGFHLFNAAFFQIGIFPWFMILATAVFFPPAWPRRVVERVRGQAGARAEPDDAPAPGGRRAVILSLLGLYCAVQLLLPFRHHFYAGPVLWNEEAKDFSWMMRIAEMRSSTKFYTADPETGRRRRLDYDPFLTPKQASAMRARPTMMVQFSHWWSDRIERITGRRLPVYVRCRASLNGRTPEERIDPDVNLAEEPLSLAPHGFIRPLREPLPPL